jgi:hypothetical protein
VLSGAGSSTRPYPPVCESLADNVSSGDRQGVQGCHLARIAREISALETTDLDVDEELFYSDSWKGVNGSDPKLYIAAQKGI